jgi:hypothetical protein
MSERKWMAARWGRKDAPNTNDLNVERNKQNGIYIDHDTVWDYKNENGRWKARRKDNKKGGWFDISDNEEAVSRLNERYPEATVSSSISPAMDDELIDAEAKENLRRIKAGELPLQAGDPWYDEFEKLRQERTNKYIAGQTKF